MTPEQKDLLIQARDSLAVAEKIHEMGHHGFASSRAYYAMFYVAEALLLDKGMAFSKHSGVHAAFGEHFVKTGIVPAEFHRYLIRGMEVRHAGDYGKARSVSPEESSEQIAHAREFLRIAERLLEPISLV